MSLTREKAQLMSASEIDRTLVRLAHEILEKTKDLDQLAFIGIRRRGVPLAQRLAQKIEALEKRKIPVGILDINLYRDDLTTVDIKPVVSATEIPFSVQGKDIILMDDVLYTGRTIRAALDALFDHGRPARVQLLVLIDRGHRELPIEAQFVGRTVQTTDIEIIEVKFQEIDGMEKVLLVRKVADGSEAVTRCPPDCSESKSWTAPRSKPFWRAPRIFSPLQSQSLKKLDTLRGKMIVNLFFEASTRTRTSFEIAAKRLGADAVSITASGSSVSKGESLVDTLNTLAAMRPDAIVMRHAASGAPHFLARHLPTPIINAGDGTHEHPTQALLDARTILDRRATLEGLRVAIIGDIAHSRVARSNVHLLSKFGAEIVLCGPASLLPRGTGATRARRAPHHRHAARPSATPT